MERTLVGWLTAATLAIGGCASGSDTGGGGGGQGAGPSGPMAGYNYRRPITVSAGAPADQALAITVDHAALVVDGKARDDGADLRIAYDDGAALREIDRTLDPTSSFDVPQTELWFRTQAPAGEGSYYLYYGRPSATDPLADPAAVFTYFDDFDGADLDPGWTVTNIGTATGADATVSGGAMRVTGTSGDIGGTADSLVFAFRQVDGDFVAEASIDAVGGSLGADSKLGGLMLRQSVADDSRNVIMSLRSNPRARLSSVRSQDGGDTTSSELAVADSFPQLVALQRMGGTVGALYSDDGRNWVQLGTGGSLGTLTDPVLLGVPIANISGGAGWVETGWLRIRPLSLPAPTAELGDEEPL